MGESGGVAAARGLQFQYLVTLRDVVDQLESARNDLVLHVEPSVVAGLAAEDPTLGEVVDYSVSTADGRLSRLVQVKSVADHARSRPMGLPVVLRVLGRLLRQPGAAEVCELVTNARLTSEAAAFVAVLDGAADPGPVLGAGRASQEVMEWANNFGDQLGRCRVSTVAEDLAQLRSVLRSRLVKYRRRHGVGSGLEAAGVLTSHAVMMIFDGATVPGGRRIKLTELSAGLLVGAEVVARAIGRYDWGRPIGSLPGLPELGRGPVVAQVEARFGPVPGPGPVPVVVLTGLSGIGKTSVAARYAFAHADDYDYVVWVNGESTATIVSTMLLVDRALTGSEAAVDGDALPEMVRLHLAEYPGRWLVVFDNANDPRVVEPWLPTVGSGHVVVTSVNATGWAARRPVAVPPLTGDESVELMAARLFDPDVTVSASDRAALARLADRLEHWPLALALAGSYLSGADRGPAASEEYLEQLRDRVVDAESAIPAGYPRTLTAAILLACDRIGALPGDLGDLGLRCLLAVSYLSAESIPADLLYLCARVEPVVMVRSGLSGPGMMVDRTEIDEVVRALRTCSLVSRAHRPSTSPLAEFVADQLEVNEIVQLVLRNRLETRAPTADVVEIVDRAAFHVQSWLAGMNDADDLDGLLLLERHATTIDAHGDRLQVTSLSMALLKGNLALARSMRGQHDQALRLLNDELEILALLPPCGPDLMMKVLSQRVAALYGLDLELSKVLDESAKIAAILCSLEPREVTSHREVVAITASQQLNLLTNLSHSPTTIPRLSELMGTFDRFARLGGGQAKVDQMNLSSRLQAMVSAGDDEAALALIAEALDRTQPLPRQARIEMLGLQAEIHALQHSMEQANRDLRDLAAIVTPDHHGDQVLTIAGNVGLPAAIALTRGDGLPAALQVLDGACALAADRLAGAHPFDVRRARLLAATAALHHRRLTEASVHLAQARSVHTKMSHGVGSDVADEYLLTALVDQLNRLERAAAACGPVPVGAPVAIRLVGSPTRPSPTVLLRVRGLDDEFRRVAASWYKQPDRSSLGLTGRWAGTSAERYLVLDSGDDTVAVSWDPDLPDHNVALYHLDHGGSLRLSLDEQYVGRETGMGDLRQTLTLENSAIVDIAAAAPAHGVGSGATPAPPG